MLAGMYNILSRIDLLMLREDRYFCVFGRPLADKSSVSVCKIGVNPALARPVCNTEIMELNQKLQ